MGKTADKDLGALKDELNSLIEEVCLIVMKQPFSELKQKGKFLTNFLAMSAITADNKKLRGKPNISSLGRDSFEKIKRFFTEELVTHNLSDENFQLLTAKFSDLEKKLALLFDSPEVSDDNRFSIILKNVYARIPTGLINSKWWLYERHGDGGAEIGRKVLIFRSTKDEKTLSVTMLPFKENTHEWIGEAKFLTADQFLVITLFNSEGQNEHVHLTIKIDNRTPELELCIGHMTLKHTGKNNVITRTVVMEKTIQDTKNITERTFSLNDVRINGDIRRFLSDRRLNRLPSPYKKEIYNIRTLGEWLKQNTAPINKMHAKLEGAYNVYYKHNVENKKLSEERKLTKDSLTFTNTTYNQLTVVYQHGIDVNETANTWRGEGFANSSSHTFQAYLKGPYESPEDDSSINNADIKPTFLLLDIPSHLPSKIDILVGIAVAPRDEDKGSVARLIILVKQNVSAGDIDIRTLILEFFHLFQHKMRVRPPSSNKIYNLQTLTDVINKERAEQTSK